MIATGALQRDAIGQIPLMIRSGITTRSQPRGGTNGFSQAQRHLGNLSTISRVAERRRPRLLKVRAAESIKGGLVQR